MGLPVGARYVIIGAGIHGLSTAWNLARDLRSSGRGSGDDVVVIDKTGVGAGASGIACGVVRNNYFQPAMRELMAHCVDVWESDPEAFSYHPVGYMQISHEAMRADVASIHAQQKAIGYSSTFIEGAEDSARYMSGIFDDWQARGITSVLHEHRGGYANNMASLKGLLQKAEAEGVAVVGGVTVTGFDRDASGSVTAVLTDQGPVACEHVVVAVGPWVQQIWAMLDLPFTADVLGGDGCLHRRPTWTYMCLQEGTLGVDPGYLTDNDNNMPPVVHIDTDAPLYDEQGLVTEGPWGIYYKPDFNFGGVHRGPVGHTCYYARLVDKPGDQVAVDPYAGPDGRPVTSSWRRLPPGPRPRTVVRPTSSWAPLRGQVALMRPSVRRHRQLLARQLRRCSSTFCDNVRLHRSFGRRSTTSTAATTPTSSPIQPRLG